MVIQLYKWQRVEFFTVTIGDRGEEEGEMVRCLRVITTGHCRLDMHVLENIQGSIVVRVYSTRDACLR